MTEEDQGPLPLCFINAKGPTAVESPARPGQMDQVPDADVLVGSKDEVTTHHGDKSNDLIWETLKTIQMQNAGMQHDFSRSTSKRRSRSRSRPPDHQAGLYLGPDGSLMIEVGTIGTIGTVVVQNMVVITFIKRNLLHIVVDQ